MSQISHELDVLACDLYGECFDVLATGNDLWPSLAFEDEKGNREIVTFADDEPGECLIAARNYFKTEKDFGSVSAPVRYALAYDALVRDEETGELLPAVIVEFGEKGAPCAYSGYSFYRVGKKPTDFMWTDPQPAGEEELLF